MHNKIRALILLLLLSPSVVITIYGSEIDIRSCGAVIITTKGAGSGFILKGGFIITNAHVIKPDNEIIISTIKKDYYVNQLYYFNPYIDLAIIKVDGLPKEDGLSLFNYETELLEDTINAILLKTADVSNVETYKTENITLHPYPEVNKFSYRIFLNQYYSDYKLINGNSGSPILYKDKVIGVVVSGLINSDTSYLSSTFISTEYIQYIIKNIDKFKPFTITNIPSKCKIYSPSGRIIGYTDLSSDDNYINFSGNVELNIDELNIFLNLKNNKPDGLSRVKSNNNTIYELNYSGGKQHGVIKIYSPLNYVRIVGKFENGLPVGNWNLFDANNKLISSLPNNKITLFEYFEDYIKALSTEYIFVYNKNGYAFTPSKFREIFIEEVKRYLNNEKLLENFDKIIAPFGRTDLDLIAEKAFNSSKK